MRQYKHKIGATFSYLMILDNVDLASLEGFEPSCQIRSRNGELWDDVACTRIETLTADQVVVFLYANEFTKWRPGVMQVDVVFTRASDNFRRPTNTFYFQALQQVTHT